MDRRRAIKQTIALTGTGLTASVLGGVLAGGCQPQGQLDWRPSALSDKEAQLVQTISEVMLPATEGPGAIDVHVPEFVDLMVRDCLTAAEQNSFEKGLVEIAEKLDELAGGSFGRQPSERQTQTLSQLDQQEFDDGDQESPYLLLKQLILLGYFTSEQVMTTSLNYHSIPGRYDACIAYDGKGAYEDNNVEGRL